MTRKTPQQSISGFQLPSIDGKHFDLQQLQGQRYLLSFFRFAGCPFCNLRVHQLIQNWDQFGDNFTVVGIFDASLENLQRNLSKHRTPFTLLADQKNKVYKEYGVERSVGGVFKGMLKYFPQLLYSMFIKGNLPTNFGGNLLTMPANFLVNERGIIEVAHYGKDEFDHLPFKQVMAFSKEELGN